MLLKKILILFITGSIFSFCKRGNEEFTYQLGNTKISIERTWFYGASVLSIVHVHDNETTAQTAAETILQQFGGSLLTLKNREQRLLHFTHQGTDYAVDPNRIFTPQGRKHTLQKWSRYHMATAEKLAFFSTYFIDLIPAEKAVIAVHNNTDKAYSINSYKKGGDLVTDAQEVYINEAQDGDDFFITTSIELFEKLKNENYNVVLQHNKRAADDGSLSIYYGRKDQTYVNVEAEHGHLEQQIKMLEVLQQVLR